MNCRAHTLAMMVGVQIKPVFQDYFQNSIDHWRKSTRLYYYLLKIIEGTWKANLIKEKKIIQSLH